MWYPVLLILSAWLITRLLKPQEDARWLPSPRTTRADQPFLWQHITGKKYRAVASYVGITAATPVQFTLERERTTHRFTKWLGFCEEFQTQSEDFDHRIFILSDASALQRILQTHGELRRKIIECFTHHDVIAITTRSGALLAQLGSMPSEPPLHDIDAILDLLHTLRRALESATPQPAARLPLITRRYVYAMPASLGAWALISLAASALMGYQILHWSPLWPLLGKALLLFTLAHAIGFRLIFARSAYGHESVLRGLLPGIAAAAFFFVSASWLINCYYDATPATQHTQLINDKYTQRGRKGSISHYLSIQAWDASGYFDLKVPKSVYQKAQVGQFIRVHAAPGRLNMPWIEKLELLQ